MEENVRDYSKQLENMKKSTRVDDETTDWRDKIRQKNKLIDELEFENQELQKENQKLNNYLEENKKELEDATFKMEKTKDDIEKFKVILT